MTIQKRKSVKVALRGQSRDISTSILSKKYSSAMQKVFDTYEAVYSQFNGLIQTRGTTLPFTRANASITSGIDRTADLVRTTSPHDKIDSILLEEIAERLGIMKIRLSFPNAETFSYEMGLKSYGVTSNDVEGLKKRFKAIDYEDLSDKLLIANGQSYSERPTGTGEVEKTKEFFVRLSKMMFDSTPQSVKASFPDFDSYLRQSVQLVEKEGGSYQSTGRVYLNVNNAEFIYIRENQGCRYQQFLDPLSAASLVGEEGLLGHQGQFLATERAAIPAFLKTGFKPATLINAEALGDAGRWKLINQLKRSDVPSTIGIKNFELLEKRFNLWWTAEEVNRFLRGYEGYSYFANNKDEALTSEALYSITKSPGYKAEEQVKRISAYYNSLPFWKEYTENMNAWGYLIAGLTREKIDDRLEKVAPEASQKIREELPIGWWTKKGFERYFDHLISTFA
ncbi:MAG: hypothetical protein KGH94_01045 [Candidatus Micrarchaeota archaeon]|nr:hypothetical protein [Candidatus Micrarchaeota archaeon]